ncbi:lipocalin-like domain-containing protein [Sphingobacterium wenxiniae]|uniref:Lipocalin-like domain-containing protein n=1 Tax=Sphingobacterium wenxiniae TaxID=683125 RepID=A0A1I6QQT0_9SPHI|nr:lipocalin-like domain-containing protein [Sphingobacterium wenxiniae]SFS54764.1 Lipocalin-like domain-containing protein [Sphingobacterium wenxiniae]
MIRTIYIFGAIAFLFLSCQNQQVKESQHLTGNYRLIESITIKGEDTIHLVVDTTKMEMIKIFNPQYFSFFNHDKSKGTDSLNNVFVSGAGTYTLQGETYIENLEYCSYRPWEGKQFTFTLEVKGDSLIQHGMEEIPELGVKQHITEKYVKLK